MANRSPPSTPVDHPARTPWDGILAVVVVALVASLTGLRNDYAQDDLYLIRDNLRIHSVGNWREILTSSYWPPPWNQELYRPLTSLLHALQFSIGWGDPLVFRVTSYLLYAGSAVGTFLLASRVLSPRMALGVGLLFSAHPVHVEAVALGVGQAELLVALLGVAMTDLYLRRRRLDQVRPRDWGLIAAGYLLASLSKEQGLLLPSMLFLVELTLISGPLWPRLRRIAPGFGGLAIIGASVVAGRLVVLGGRFARNFTAEALDGLGFGDRFLTMLQVVPEWLRLLAWPAHLQADYSPQEIVASTTLGPTGLLGLVLLAAGAAALVASWRRAPAIAFGIGWCALALFPVSNLLLVSGIVLAERTLFLPSIGFLIGCGGLMSLVAARFRRPGPARPGGDNGAERRILVTPLAVATAALVGAGVLRSAERHRVWRNEAFFSVRGVQDAPRSFRMQRAYAEILFELGQRPLALEAYQKAISLSPPVAAWRVRNDLARRLQSVGERAGEAEQLEASLANEPDQEEARANLIAAYLHLGRYADAKRQADTAVARLPGRSAVFRQLGRLADSAKAADAPPGTVRIRINTVPAPARN